MKISLIFILLMAACTTEPVETHDDNAILQLLLNMADSSAVGFLINEFDLDGNGTLYCMELPNTLDDTVACTMENGRFTKIKLSNMGLSGAIPESIGDLTELTHLGLKNNNLNGEIPESIGNLINLTQLSLGYNSLSGGIPESIGNLKNLMVLDVSHNNLEGSIPNSIRSLTALVNFLADSNNLNLIIPDDFCIIYPNLGNYDLSGNQFCPPLPYCIDSPNIIGYQNCDTSCGLGNTYLNGYCYSQTDLEVLQELIDSADSLNMVMDTDTIAGVQPLELGFQEWQSGRLKTLDCYWDTVSCNLSTEFSINIINLDSLEYLDIQQNNITGSISETLADLTNLKDLNISNNQLSGYLPESLCIDDTTVWIDINLKYNQFCPCYPECINITDQDISDCSYCIDGYTQICGHLPETVSIIEGDPLCFEESNLNVLRTFIDSSSTTLSDNFMSMDVDGSGIIEPQEIGVQVWENGKLISFDARNHGLSGGIPSEIGQLTNLEWLFLNNNQLTGEIPESIANLTEITRLQLHNNLISGDFPERICTDLELDWSEELLPESSSIFNNQLCPPYPECIKLYVGEQDTLNCH